MKDIRIEDILVHDRFVRRLALQLMGDAATADDVAQEVYLKAMGRGPKEGGSIRAWLATVLRNIGANVRRGGQRRSERERRASRPESVRDTESSIVEREELRRRLVAAIVDLGKPRSTILLLRYFEGVSPRGIAARLDMPVETVRTHLKRSLVLLRSRLESETGPGGGSLLGALPILFLGPASAGAWIGVVVTTKTKIALASACVVVALGVWVAAPAIQSRFARKSHAGAGSSASIEDSGAPAAIAPPGVGKIVPRHAVEEAAESTPTTSVEGNVVDAAGKGVAGARVIASDLGEPIMIGGAESRPAQPAPPSATTDASGKFRIELQPPARVLTLSATAAGFSPAMVTPVGFGSRQTLVLEKPLTIVGRTLDTTGKAVSGARVRWSSGGEGVTFARDAVSGPDGRYRIEDLPSGSLARAMLRGMVLEARAEGFAPLAVFVGPNYRESLAKTVSVNPGSVLERDLVLARGVRVQGRVTEAETGSPIANADVTFHSWVSADVLRDSGLARGEKRSTRSDADGRYAFDALPSLGFHVLGSRVAGNPVGLVRAKPDGFAEVSVQVPESPEGGVLDLDLACWRTARVRGRVIDAAGAPQSDFEVWAYVRALGDSQVRPVTTGSDGRFVVDAIPARSSEPTTVQVHANPPGASALQLGAGAPGSREVGLRAGDDVTLDDFVLDPLPAVRFRVVDPSGLPIQGATARSSWIGFPPPTDRDGRCTLAFRPDALGERRLVRITASGFGSAAIEDVVPSLKPAETTVVMKPSRKLRGRVLWSDRTPARGIDVVLTEGRAPREIAAADVPAEADYFRFDHVRATSDDDGRIELSNLLDGPYWIAAGFGPRTQSDQPPPEPHVLLRDVRDAEFEIVLPPDPTLEAVRANKGIVEGTVTSAATRSAVVSFTASLSRAETWIPCSTPTLGQYRFEGVPPGKWLLRIESPGLVPFERAIEIAEAPQRIDASLDEGLVVFGKISVAKNVRLAEVQVLFTRGGIYPGPGAKIAADGSYRASGLTAGTYFIDVWYPNAGFWDKALAATPPLMITLAAGNPPVHRDLEIRRGGWISVNVAPELIKPEGRTILTAVDTSGSSVRELDLSENCTGFTMGLVEGTYRIRVSAGGTVIASAEAEVVEGTPATVSLK